MSKESSSENDGDKDNLHKEYEVCFSNWRFFVGLRFTVLAFFLTLNSGLLYAFLNMTGEKKQQPYMILPPLVGIVAVYAGFIIDNRIRQLYFACIRRAKQIEDKLRYADNEAKRIPRLLPRDREKKPDIMELAKKNSIAKLLDDCCPVTIFSWQALAVWVIYLVLIIVWFILFFIAAEN